MRLSTKALIVLLLIGINIKAYPSPLCDFLWVPCFFSNDVYKVNVVTHEVAEIIPVGGGPAGVAVGPNMVYVTCRYSSRLYCVSKFYDAVVDSFELSPHLAFGIGVALDGRNQIYVVGQLDSTNFCMSNSLLLKLSPDGIVLDSLRLVVIQGYSPGPEFGMSIIGIAIREPEIMIPWMCSWDGRTGICITDTSMDGFVDYSINPLSYGYRGPGAAYDESDRGWSSGERAGQNYIIDHWREDSWNYHSIGRWYIGNYLYGDVAVDDSGYVWTGNALGFIIRYDPALHETTSFRVTSDLNEVRGISIDNYGYIWVALSPVDSLYKFDSAGNMIGPPVGIGSHPMGFGDMTGHEYGHRMTAIDDRTPLPEAASLLTAYPNPFNASTLISYSLAEPGPVNITVYDLLGREMITLYEGDQDAGEHVVAWNANAFSSGIYFARLRTADYSGSLRILLVK